VGSEAWHRNVLAAWNLYLRALQGDGSNAPSPGGPYLNGRLVPLGSTATSEATRIEKSQVAEVELPTAIQSDAPLHKMKR